MARNDPLEEPPEAEESYHDSADEDFDPTTAPADESSSSSDEEDAPAKAAQPKRKRKAPAIDELDSGDEVTIEAAKKRKSRKRKGDKGRDEDDLMFSDDEGGEGGLVKTRAQRRVEQQERRPLARTEGATVNVDALWAQMSSAPLRSLYPDSTLQVQEQEAVKTQDAAADGTITSMMVDSQEDLVSIQKIYTFAGQRTTEDKQVPRSTLDRHIAEGWKPVDAIVQETGGAERKEDGAEAENTRSKIRRPLRRPSRFDPNPTGYVRTLPPEHQLTWPRKTVAAASAGHENVLATEASKLPRTEKAQKLNVVDKSRLDWTGFVDKEGIADELAVHGKTKEAYLGRMEFLAGVEARREEERRRLKTAAAT